jgi:two-component system chemotaxis response regulator CheY
MNYIMVIDDSPTVRTSVEYNVKQLGYPVKQAEDGADALNQIRDIKETGNDIAMCVVDINMPGMDGITFVREFRKIDRFTPILILTTESGSKRIEEGRAAGASGWMVKPYQSYELLSTAKRLIH